MAEAPIRLPAGVRDFLPRATQRRRAVAEALQGLFETWGYQAVITPAFECEDVLARGLGVDARAEAIRFVAPGSGEVVALRPDMTPQVARMVATRLTEAVRPLRLAYEGAVHRLVDGAPREVLQAGVERIGGPRAHGDAELIALACEALARTALTPRRLVVGTVAPTRWLLRAAGDVSPALAEDLRAALADHDAPRARRVARQLTGPAATIAAEVAQLHAEPEAAWARAQAWPWPAEVRAELDAVATALVEARALSPAVAAAEVAFEVTDVRGFDYYTGLRVAGYAEGAADAVLRGGRYDHLLARFGAPEAAVGFAIDIEAVAVAQAAAGQRVRRPLPDVVLWVSPDEVAPAAAYAATLRACGVTVALDVAAADAPRTVATGVTARWDALGWQAVGPVRPPSMDPAALAAWLDNPEQHT